MESERSPITETYTDPFLSHPNYSLPSISSDIQIYVAVWFWMQILSCQFSFQFHISLSSTFVKKMNWKYSKVSLSTKIPLPEVFLYSRKLRFFRNANLLLFFGKMCTPRWRWGVLTNNKYHLKEENNNKTQRLVTTQKL